MMTREESGGDENVLVATCFIELFLLILIKMYFRKATLYRSDMLLPLTFYIIRCEKSSRYL